MSAIDDMEKNDPDWLKNPMGPAFADVGIITPEAIAQDTVLIRNECRSIIETKRTKKADRFKAMAELGKADDRIANLTGIKPVEKHEVEVTERKLVKI